MTLLTGVSVLEQSYYGQSKCTMFEGEGVSTTVDGKDSLKHSTANGEGNSNLTTQSSIFNLMLKTRVIESLLINYLDTI